MKNKTTRPPLDHPDLVPFECVEAGIYRWWDSHGHQHQRRLTRRQAYKLANTPGMASVLLDNGNEPVITLDDVTPKGHL